MNFTELAVIVNDIHYGHCKIDITNVKIIPIIKSDSSIKTYHSYITQTLKFKGIDSINMYLLDYRQKHILGRYQKYRNSIDIWVSNSLSNCWTRYVTTKELSHLIVDTKETSLTVDIHTTILWMLQDGMNKGVNDALDSEHIAAQLAIEVLLPYKLTQHLLRDNTVSNIEIANRFKVPLRIIESIKNTKFNYLEQRDRAYSDLD
jgi:Zn-dependent peptidase ImmA (M78 family)